MDSLWPPPLPTVHAPVLALLWLRVVVRAGGPSKRQAAHVKFHAPAPGDSGKNISRERRSDPLIYGLLRARPLRGFVPAMERAGRVAFLRR